LIAWKGVQNLFFDVDEAEILHNVLLAVGVADLLAL
jgi:hypothetical protein